MINKKVIITGSFGVGKTSLFNQFIYKRFSDKYLTTIGVKVNKKVIEVEGKELSILLWDIAGEVSQDKVPNTYFLGAKGIIYVFDLSRPTTYQNLKENIEYLQKMVKNAVIKIVGNKKDKLSTEELVEVNAQLPLPLSIMTSAKTGENVEELFKELGKDLLKA